MENFCLGIVRVEGDRHVYPRTAGHKVILDWLSLHTAVKLISFSFELNIERHNFWLQK